MNTFKGLYEFVVWNLLTVSHHFAMFRGHWSSASGNMTYLTCHLACKNHLNEGSSNFMTGALHDMSPSSHV